MKVVCIDDYTLSGIKIFGLTVGKIYDARNIPIFQINVANAADHNLEFTYRIVDDNGLINWYNDEVLMPLEKYRELKLKEIGI
jgi:hypothetical protein